jgi:hypothetical protein
MLVSSSGFHRPKPALFTNTSTGPSSVEVRTSRRAIESSSARSVTTGTATPPARQIPAATRSSSSPRRAASATRAPSAASIAARPAPIPDEAPVTKATRSASIVISHPP